MSNATHKRRMAELRAHRAQWSDYVQARPEVASITSVVIRRTGRYINKRVGWTKPNGEQGGCTMRIREVTCNVKTRQIRQVQAREVALVSGMGARPNYQWTGPSIRSGDAPCGTAVR
jgi:hypothetical protein